MNPQNIYAKTLPQLAYELFMLRIEIFSCEIYFPLQWLAYIPSHLPVIVLFVPQLHQQITGDILEYVFMLILEIFLPLAGFA